MGAQYKRMEGRHETGFFLHLMKLEVLVAFPTPSACRVDGVQIFTMSSVHPISVRREAYLNF